MKKMKITIWTLSAVLCVILMSCSNEENAEKYYFSSLQFDVNVNVPNDATRASLNRKTWEKGDRIAMAIDGDETNVAFLEYIGDGDWTVSQLNENTHLSGTSGNLSAVYAEDLDYQMGNVKTGGDVLYTQSGTYEIRDNIARIRLSMSERPVSRIAIVGLNSSYWLENIEEFTLLKSLVSMEWDTSVKSKGGNNKNVYGDTCVFYGILPPDNSGCTTISLINTDGAYHKRTYEGKQVLKGDYVILNGPETSEGSKWESNVPVKGIKATKNSISMDVGDMLHNADLYDIYPSDATNKNIRIESSNNDILEIDVDGNCKALKKGNVVLTITTEDGNYSCIINVEVFDIDHYIYFWKKEVAKTTINGIVVASSVSFEIINQSKKKIHLVKIDDVSLNNGNGYDIESNSSQECTLSAQYQDITLKSQFTLYFTCDGREFSLINKNSPPTNK